MSGAEWWLFRIQPGDEVAFAVSFRGLPLAFLRFQKGLDRLFCTRHRDGRFVTAFHRYSSDRTFSHLSKVGDLFFGIFVLFVMVGPSSGAACTIDSRSLDGAFFRRLGPDCTNQDREDNRISADEILQAVMEKKPIDLDGVVIVGDLFLDRLPVTAVEAVDLLSQGLLEELQARRVSNVRVIPASVSITNSRVRGAVGTRTKAEFLIAKGPVKMAGTRFERMVDWSRTIFMASVDFSGAVMDREGFFIQSIFNRSASFERAVFGAHARFHRALFKEDVTFHNARFEGLAEFLEVSFTRSAAFSNTLFKMGTGFSGSRFEAEADFSDAGFEREVYFLFTVFDKNAVFREAVFQGVTDFSDAQFKGRYDFSGTLFRLRPHFNRTQMNGVPPNESSEIRLLYGIAATFAVLTVIVLLLGRKRT
jgi:hypothetical protein